MVGVTREGNAGLGGDLLSDIEAGNIGRYRGATRESCPTIEERSWPATYPSPYAEHEERIAPRTLREQARGAGPSAQIRRLITVDRLGLTEIEPCRWRPHEPPLHAPAAAAPIRLQART